MAISKLRLKLILVTGIIWIPFFVYKIYNLTNYKFYEGTVTKIEEVNISVKQFRGRPAYETVHVPEVEYIRSKDIIVFSEGTRTIFSYLYDEGDQVTVMEQKDDESKINILAPWYYIKTYEIILVLLLSGIVGGIYWAVATGFFKE